MGGRKEASVFSITREPIMSKESGIVLSECLYWDCECGHRNYAHWIAEEISSKYLERIRRKKRTVGKTYWSVRIPDDVTCEGCGATERTLPFVCE